MTMSAFASSSRSVLTQTTRLLRSTPGVQRGFSSTTQAKKEFHLRIANIRAVFDLPSLPSWLSTSSNDAGQVPALAGTIEAALAQEAESNENNDASPFTWDGILNAVPKSRVSHSRKSMRSANKGLKDRVNFVHCPGCGQPKLAHHICAHCYGVIARQQKAALRQQATKKDTADVDVTA